MTQQTTAEKRRSIRAAIVSLTTQGITPLITMTCRSVEELLDDADTLAAALETAEWLRGALFAITKADDLDEAMMIANAALATE